MVKSEAMETIKDKILKLMISISTLLMCSHGSANLYCSDIFEPSVPSVSGTPIVYSTHEMYQKAIENPAFPMIPEYAFVGELEGRTLILTDNMFNADKGVRSKLYYERRDILQEMMTHFKDSGVEVVEAPWVSEGSREYAAIVDGANSKKTPNQVAHSLWIGKELNSIGFTHARITGFVELHISGEYRNYFRIEYSKEELKNSKFIVLNSNSAATFH